MKKIVLLIFYAGLFVALFTACASEMEKKGMPVQSDMVAEKEEASSDISEDENESTEVLTDISELTEWKDQKDYSGGSHIWFGSFPKNECTVYDTVEDIWQKIINANYTEDNTAEIDGKKYVRVMNEDDSTYHYYEYEPLLWKVIKVTKEKLVLFSEEALYNIEGKKIREKGVNEFNWKRSVLRSWLNGYGAEENAEQKDYTSDNFIRSAFNTDEKSVLVDTSGVKALHDEQKDKVTLYYLSEQEPASGWVLHHFQTNLCTATDYANAVGVECMDTVLSDEDTCNWQVRITNKKEEIMSQVSYAGTEDIMGLGSNIYSFTARPVICIDTQQAIEKKLCVLKYNSENELSEEEKEFRLDDWQQLNTISSIFESSFDDYFLDLPKNVENPIKYAYEDIVELSKADDTVLNECAKRFLKEIGEKYGDPIEWKSSTAKKQTLYLMYEFAGDNKGTRAKIGDIFTDRD